MGSRYVETPWLNAVLIGEAAASIQSIQFNPETTAVIWKDVEIIFSCDAVRVMFILPPLEHLHNLCHQLDQAIDSVS